MVDWAYQFLMWQQLRNRLREAEHNRLVREARAARESRPADGGRVRTWLVHLVPVWERKRRGSFWGAAKEGAMPPERGDYLI